MHGLLLYIAFVDVLCSIRIIYHCKYMISKVNYYLLRLKHTYIADSIACISFL